MRSGRSSAAIACLATALSACSGRGGEARKAAPAAAAQPAATAPDGSAVPHGDHNPHHGGIVMMKGSDLHYEVVLDPAGRAHAVYFTDAVREDLPASVASAVALTIKRPGAADERIPLRIDDAGESWVGSGRAIADPAQTQARVEFTIRG